MNSKHLIPLVFLVSLISCKQGVSTAVTTQSKKEVDLRPNFHFSPKANWMNDPNGMFYHAGNYHLFFQYYPDSTVWGPMHWGHAVSKDMIDWEEREIALYPDSLGYIFSGSAVVDKNNTSGLGKEGKAPIVALFTYHDPEKEKQGATDYQNQGLAFSLDGGFTWEKYANNPVILNPGMKDFRDPKVTWVEEYQFWLMALATYEKTLFYRSNNLIDWEYLSDFGENLGAHGGVWECPDLFPMQIEGAEKKWVLLQSLNPGGANGGSGTQYFVGDFDGKQFTIDPLFTQQLRKGAQWVDFGRDNYAGVTWSGIPKEDGRILFLGWMSNWNYANKVPTGSWRGTMTLPRELKLKKTADEYKLYAFPAAEIEQYYGEPVHPKAQSISGDHTLVSQEDLSLASAHISKELEDLKEDNYVFTLENDRGESFKFGVNNRENYFFIDRSQSGEVSFSDNFADQISKAEFGKTLDSLKVDLWIDRTSIEIFYNHGEFVMTEIFFPKENYQSLNLESAGEFQLKKLTANPIKMIKNE